MIADHKLLAAFWTTWTMAIATYAAVRVFDDPGSINAYTVGALSAVLAVPAVFIKLYQWLKPKASK